MFKEISQKYPELTSLQIHILEIAQERPKLTIKDFCYQCKLNNKSGYWNIAKLVQMNLLTTAVDPGDRRQRLVYIDYEGIKLLQLLKQNFTNNN